MPSGSEATMPTVATTMVTRMPPHNEVGTLTRPSNGAPLRSRNDRIGSTIKK